MPEREECPHADACITTVSKYSINFKDYFKGHYIRDPKVSDGSMQRLLSCEEPVEINMGSFELAYRLFLTENSLSFYRCVRHYLSWLGKQNLTYAVTFWLLLFFWLSSTC